jgi:hypothetical protein
LALNYLEIVKNMPYSQVGTQNGNPAGDLADQYAPIPAKIEAFNYQIYYEVTYIDDPSDGTALLSTDSAPNDYKQVKMKVQNMTTGKITTFATNIVPKGLEISTGGALLVNVINSQGVPVSGANVHIDFPTSSPYTIQLDRTTDAEGRVLELDLPVGVNSYRIVVTKAGYSSDQTYPVTALNPNPAKPDATIALGQVTAITFSIDLLSNLNIWTLDNTCQGIGGVGVNVRGDKLIGENPNVYKFNNNYYSSASGLIDLASIIQSPDIQIRQKIDRKSYGSNLAEGNSCVRLGGIGVECRDRVSLVGRVSGFCHHDAIRVHPHRQIEFQDSPLRICSPVQLDSVG